MRIGFGYDSHRLVAGRRLVLGGKTIPHERGLLGHSDADVLIHAVCDAILGAVGEGDIGRQFPDTDPAYQNISSLTLLENVGALVAAKDYRVFNVDSTIILERPKLAAYLGEMAENIVPQCRLGLRYVLSRSLGMGDCRSSHKARGNPRNVSMLKICSC